MSPYQLEANRETLCQFPINTPVLLNSADGLPTLGYVTGYSMNSLHQLCVIVKEPAYPKDYEHVVHPLNVPVNLRRA